MVAALLLVKANDTVIPPVALAVTCAPAGDCHAPGSVITVDIRSRADLPLLPDVLGGGAPSFALNASHTVPVGQFRDVQ